MTFETDTTTMRQKGRELLAEALHALIFLTRLPFTIPDDMKLPELAKASRFFGLAGLVIGIMAGIGGALGFWLGLSPFAAAGVALGVGILTSGAMAEDGLADMADGFWGGRDKAHKLEIVRDSRIGTYGVLALALSLLLRAGLMAQILSHTGGLTLVACLAGAACLGRGLMAGLMADLPPARADGLSATTGQPDPKRARQGIIFVSIMAGSLWLVTGGLLAAALALAFGFGAAKAITYLSKQHIEGQTGDVCGALASCVEVASLAGLAMVLGNL